MKYEIKYHRTADNKEPVTEWLYALRDKVTRIRIENRIQRMREGNLGKHKHFSGIFELIIDFGPGYRVYCGKYGNTLIILLTAGDKGAQNKDIQLALKYWEDYK